ncbi:MAG: class I SAM-dependent methyltransferase [Treponema sp.]|nr:class I SAM-dependent methyltransferase [Treponema sp.]
MKQTEPGGKLTDTAHIIRYYNTFNEEHRLTTRHGTVEFTTTMHYIQKEIARIQDLRREESGGSASEKSSPIAIADIGAGTGRYSVALSRLGHTVTAVELVPKNLAVLEAKHEKVNCWPGDARDLSFLEDESFDITLLLGPLYHLHSENDRLKALSEAKRITRKGGVIFAGYVMNEYSVLTYCFKQQHISEVLEKGELTADWHTKADKDELYSYLRLEDINALRQAAGLERRLIFAADGAADYMRRELNALTESDFAHFIDYHLATCERAELLGASSHTVDVLQKL